MKRGWLKNILKSECQRIWVSSAFVGVSFLDFLMDSLDFEDRILWGFWISMCLLRMIKKMAAALCPLFSFSKSSRMSLFLRSSWGFNGFYLCVIGGRSYRRMECASSSKILGIHLPTQLIQRRNWWWWEMALYYYVSQQKNFKMIPKDTERVRHLSCRPW